MSIAELNDPRTERSNSLSSGALPPSAATLQVWVGPARDDTDRRWTVDRPLPAFVFHPAQARLTAGRIDLADYGFAHRVTAIAFAPGDDCSSVTLIDGLHSSLDERVAELEIGGRRFVDLYSVGWAARTAAVIFNR